jgi:hypothetical protein
MMKFRTVIECVVILAAASIACGSDYHQRVEDVTCQAADATFRAEQLPVLTPWAEYEFYRGLAIEFASDSRYGSTAADMWANNADGWWSEYSKLMVKKVTGQGYSITDLNTAKMNYDKAVANCFDCCDKAALKARLSMQQTAYCYVLLKQ